MRRNLLLASVTIMVFIGLAFLSIPFLSAFNPSAKSKAARSQHDISSLREGDYIFEYLKRESAWATKVLIIKDWDGVLYSFLVPTKSGKVSMPDKFWGRSAYFCSEFRPEVELNGKIKKFGFIKCHDQETPEFWGEQWHWTYDGKTKSRIVKDIYSPRHEIIGNVLYINH